MGWGGPGKRPGVRAVWLKSLPEQSEPDVGDKEAALREEPFPLHMPSWLSHAKLVNSSHDAKYYGGQGFLASHGTEVSDPP